jgi:hypothetical protein
VVLFLIFSVASCGGDSDNDLGRLVDTDNTTISGVELLSLEDDVSRRSDEPGQHEWWNFLAEDASSGLAISTIFLNGNLYDVNYRIALEQYRADPQTQTAPRPEDYVLLQLNVIKDGRKVFSSVKLPPGSTANFERERPYGYIGNSWFEGVEENGEHFWRVHIDSPDMFNWLRLEADLEYRDISQGCTVAGGGFFRSVPGGLGSGIHFPIAKPVTTGHVRITNRLGKVILDEDLAGGGHFDHIFGKFYSDLTHSYYFGRLDLGADGGLLYFYHYPRDPDVPPHGWLLRFLTSGRTPVAHQIETLTGSHPETGSTGLGYPAVIQMTLAGGGTARTHMERTAASEDWPFQVTGIGHFNIHIPGDVDVTDAIGMAEYGYFDGLDDPLFRFLYSLLDSLPWIP